MSRVRDVSDPPLSLGVVVIVVVLVIVRALCLRRGRWL